MSPSLRARLTVAVIALAIIGLDLATKAWALAALADSPVDVIDGMLTFRLVFNPGAAFGTFQGAGPILGIVAIAATVWIIYYAGRVERILTLIGLGLIAGGAIGNVIDRIAREPYWFGGHVVDFVDLHWWPVFNVADSAVVIGVILVIFTLGRASSEDMAEASDDPAAVPVVTADEVPSSPSPADAPDEDASPANASRGTVRDLSDTSESAQE